MYITLVLLFHLVHLRSKTAFDQYCEKEAQENDKHGNRASKSIAASVEDHVNHQGTWYFTCVSRTAAGQYIDQVKGLQRTGYRKDHTHTQNRLDHRNCDIT